MFDQPIAIFSEKLNLDELRYRLYFSYENIYGIFRSNPPAVYPATSADCNLCGIYEHDCTSFQDVLQDVLLKNRVGGFSLIVNDVVCIKMELMHVGPVGMTLQSP